MDEHTARQQEANAAFLSGVVRREKALLMDELIADGDALAQWYKPSPPSEFTIWILNRPRWVIMLYMRLFRRDVLREAKRIHGAQTGGDDLHP